ncbi:MAG TPA: GNAT family N-acetyltransferase [Solirubrobacteraceae bacterium]|nr:GNAT family N-acetyltransferase [Solirubrobacteraceae bacterium]
MPAAWIAQPQEADAVTRLMLAFRDHLGLDRPGDDDARASVARLLADPETEFVLAAAEPGARAAGVAQLRYRYGFWRSGGDCLLEDVYVDATARGTGLGRALVQATLERARERGCRRAELDVNESNAAALALYESFGFSAAANPYGARDLYMRLHLD